MYKQVGNIPNTNESDQIQNNGTHNYFPQGQYDEQSLTYPNPGSKINYSEHGNINKFRIDEYRSQPEAIINYQNPNGQFQDIEQFLTNNTKRDNQLNENLNQHPFDYGNDQVQNIFVTQQDDRRKNTERRENINSFRSPKKHNKRQHSRDNEFTKPPELPKYAGYHRKNSIQGIIPIDNENINEQNINENDQNYPKNGVQDIQSDPNIQATAHPSYQYQQQIDINDQQDYTDPTYIHQQIQPDAQLDYRAPHTNQYETQYQPLYSDSYPKLSVQPSTQINSNNQQSQRYSDPQQPITSLQSQQPPITQNQNHYQPLDYRDQTNRLASSYQPSQYNTIQASNVVQPSSQCSQPPPPSQQQVYSQSLPPPTQYYAQSQYQNPGFLSRPKFNADPQSKVINLDIAQIKKFCSRLIISNNGIQLMSMDFPDVSLPDDSYNTLSSRTSSGNIQSVSPPPTQQIVQQQQPQDQQLKTQIPQNPYQNTPYQIQQQPQFPDQTPLTATPIPLQPSIQSQQTDYYNYHQPYQQESAQVYTQESASPLQSQIYPQPTFQQNYQTQEFAPKTSNVYSQTPPPSLPPPPQQQPQQPPPLPIISQTQQQQQPNYYNEQANSYPPVKQQTRNSEEEQEQEEEEANEYESDDNQYENQHHKYRHSIDLQRNDSNNNIENNNKDNTNTNTNDNVEKNDETNAVNIVKTVKEKRRPGRPRKIGNDTDIEPPRVHKKKKLKQIEEEYQLDESLGSFIRKGKGVFLVPNGFDDFLNDKSIIINPCKVGFQPKNYWEQYDKDVTFGELVQSYFSVNDKNSKFIFKLYDMLLLTSNYENLRQIVGFNWVSDFVFSISRMSASAMLNLSITHLNTSFLKTLIECGFCEVTHENFAMAHLESFPEINEKEVKLYFHQDFRFSKREMNSDELDSLEVPIISKKGRPRTKYPGRS